MKNLLFNLVHPLIGAGVIVDQWFGISEAGNIAIATIWLLIFITFITIAFGDDKDIGRSQSTGLNKYLNRILFSVNAIILFAAGWFFTGFVFLLAWASMWLKRFNATTESNKAT